MNMLNKQKYESIDNTVSEEANGAYTLPLDRNERVYRIRDLDKYCTKKGIEPKDLSLEEMEQFRVQ
jgi:hypothetical protein